jgi:hypothetical protein
MVLFLDADSAVIAADLMFRGDAETVMVSLAEVARAALHRGAHSIVVGHNHPKGCATPSAADIAFTRRLRVVMTLACIPVRDHIIVASNEIYSMAERGPWAAPLAELAVFLGQPDVLQTHAIPSPTMMGIAASQRQAPLANALSVIADIAAGSTTANSLPHIAKIAKAALGLNAGAKHAMRWLGGRS